MAHCRNTVAVVGKDGNPITAVTVRALSVLGSCTGMVQGIEKPIAVTSDTSGCTIVARPAAAGVESGPKVVPLYV